MIDAHERADAPVVAAQLENLLDDGAVLALELAGQLGAGGDWSGRSSTSTRSTPSRVGVRRAGDRAVASA